MAKAEKKTDPATVTVEMPRTKTVLVFGRPSEKDYFRFFHKLMSGKQELSARKELLQLTCQSHSLEDLQKELKRQAGAIGPISKLDMPASVTSRNRRTVTSSP